MAVLSDTIPEIPAKRINLAQFVLWYSAHRWIVRHLRNILQAHGNQQSFELKFAAAAAASETAWPCQQITSYHLETFFIYNLTQFKGCYFEIYILFHESKIQTLIK
jgi:hypothetical protein